MKENNPEWVENFVAHMRRKDTGDGFWEIVATKDITESDIERAVETFPCKYYMKDIFYSSFRDGLSINELSEKFYNDRNRTLWARRKMYEQMRGHIFRVALLNRKYREDDSAYITLDTPFFTIHGKLVPFDKSSPKDASMCISHRLATMLERCKYNTFREMIADKDFVNVMGNQRMMGQKTLHELLSTIKCLCDEYEYEPTLTIGMVQDLIDKYQLPPDTRIVTKNVSDSVPGYNMYYDYENDVVTIERHSFNKERVDPFRFVRH